MVCEYRDEVGAEEGEGEDEEGGGEISEGVVERSAFSRDGGRTRSGRREARLRPKKGGVLVGAGLAFNGVLKWSFENIFFLAFQK